MGIVDFISKKQEKEIPRLSISEFYNKYKDDLREFFPDPSVKDFYAQHRTEILELVGKTEKPELKNYRYMFTSLKGNRYFYIPQDMEVPFLRFTKGLELSHWFQNGIAPHEFDRIRDEMKVCLAHIKAKTDKAEKMVDNLSLLDAELDRRRRQALPYFVIVNLCANFLIREDENPMEISAPIHEDKCDEIEAELAAGRNGFFLTVPQLTTLIKGQNFSSEELTMLLDNSRKEAEKDKAFLKAYISWKDAELKRRTS